MRRDQKSQSFLYHSTVSSNLNQSTLNNRPLQRESLPIEQFLPPNRIQESHHQRMSNSIDSHSANNPFAHLRNQIGNLRIEFAKILQKDGVKYPKQINPNKRQENLLAQSVIISSEDSSKKVDNCQTLIFNQHSKDSKPQNCSLNNDQYGNATKIDKKYTFQTIKFGGNKQIYMNGDPANESSMVCQLKILQDQNKFLKKNLENVQKQLDSLNNEFKKEKLQNEQMKQLHKNEMNKIMLRNDQKIKFLEQIHQKDINEIIQKLKQSENANKKVQYSLIQKEQQYTKLERRCDTLKQNLQVKISQLNVLEKQNVSFKIKNQLDMKLMPPQLNESLNDEEINALKIENLKLIQQIHRLIELLNVKQGLIMNLCNDMKILEHEFRKNSHLKNALSSNLGIIQDLNYVIMNLSLQKLNKKYDHA